jgi:hypothetical protein
MSTPPISTGSEIRIELLFSVDEQELVRSLLRDECGNSLPGLESADPEAMDRFRFAVLKLSQGELPKLEDALRLAKADWRDLLMAAGFGESLSAHQSWMPKQKHG